MKTDRHYVVIMDIIGSAKLQDRDQLTNRLLHGMKELNWEYEKDILAPFEITRGDEFVAVLSGINHLYEMIKMFHETLSPVEFRTVVAYGELQAGLGSGQSLLIDGPAFQQADVIMRKLKKTSMTFSMNTGLNEWDQIAQAAMNLLLWHLSGFTPLQRKIVRLYQNYRNQNKVASEINRTQQQVQMALESCHWDLIEEAENSIRDTLKIVEEKVAYSVV